ncbi:MAG: hypothetical protein OK452_09080 [Thaumarchaeota archaeon]|nr:hypothetical protein [Nitrososphaerota archaeon]
MTSRYSRRQLRGLGIVATGRRITRTSDSTFQVKSQSGVGFYWVRTHAGKFSCECADYQKVGKHCKHIFAVEFSHKLPAILEMNSGALSTAPYPQVERPLPRPRMKVTRPSLVKYD